MIVIGGEFAETFEAAKLIGMHDVSVMAFQGDESVGVMWALLHFTDLPILAPGRTLADAERLKFLGIGVRKVAQGQGSSDPTGAPRVAAVTVSPDGRVDTYAYSRLDSNPFLVSDVS